MVKRKSNESKEQSNLFEQAKGKLQEQDLEEFGLEENFQKQSTNGQKQSNNNQQANRSNKQKNNFNS